MILKLDVTKKQLAQLTAFLISSANFCKAPEGWNWHVSVDRGSGTQGSLELIKLVEAKESAQKMSVTLVVETVLSAKHPMEDSRDYALPLTPLIQMFQAIGLAPEKLEPLQAV